LKGAEVTQPNVELEELLKRGTVMAKFQRLLHSLKRCAPLNERIARAFGVLTMEAGRLNENVIVVVRYLLGTCGFLDKQRFQCLIEQFRQLDGRFPLARYIVDRNSDFGRIVMVHCVLLKCRNDLMRCLKNVLSLICGAHPCVLKFALHFSRQFASRIDLCGTRDVEAADL
jgi:hypothetical protein